MTEHGTRVIKREHRHVHKLLSAYVDEELSNRDRSRVEQHLSQCTDCRADLYSLRWTKRLLGQAPALKVPRSFVVREADLQRSRPRRRRRSLWATQWATAAVALLFVVVMGSDLLLGGGAMRLDQSAPEAAWGTEESGPPLAMIEGQEEAKAVAVESDAPVRPRDDGAGVGAGVTPDAANIEMVPEARGVQTDTTATEMAPPETERMMIKAESETPEAEVMLAAPEKEETTPVPPPLAAPEREEATPLPGEGDLRAGTNADETPDDAPAEATYSRQETGPNLRLVWRVVEVVLGAALIGLLAAVFWLRRRG